MAEPTPAVACGAAGLVEVSGDVLEPENAMAPGAPRLHDHAPG